MYPRISDLLKDLFGISIPLPIATFGFFVAIAFITAHTLFTDEMRRKENEGLLNVITRKNEFYNRSFGLSDYIPAILFGALFGYKLIYAILNYKLFASHPDRFILSPEGNYLGILIGAAVGYYLKKKEIDEIKSQQQPEFIVVHPYMLVGTMTFLAAGFGLLGAKIFHNLENLDEFFRNPVEAMISFSGLTMYGGLILGAAAVIYYARKNSINIWATIDSCAPGLMLAYAIGRIGCHLSGDGDWGIVNLNPKPGFLSFLPDWIWAFSYPHNVINDGVPIAGCIGEYCNALPEAVYPTAFYEAIACSALFGILWFLRKKISVPGMIFMVYLIFNGIERFFIEKIRVNTEYNILGGITQAEIISTVLFILGTFGIIYLNKMNKRISTTNGL